MKRSFLAYQKSAYSLPLSQHLRLISYELFQPLAGLQFFHFVNKTSHVDHVLDPQQL